MTRRCGTTEPESGVCRVTLDGKPYGRAFPPITAQRLAEWLEGAIADGLPLAGPRGPVGPLRVEPYQRPEPTPDEHGARAAAEIVRRLRGGE